MFEDVFQQGVSMPRSSGYIWTCFSFSALGNPSRRLNRSKSSPAWTPPPWDLQKSLGFRSLSTKGDWRSWRRTFRSLLLHAFLFYTTSSPTPFKNIVKEKAFIAGLKKHSSCRATVHPCKWSTKEQHRNHVNLLVSSGRNKRYLKNMSYYNILLSVQKSKRQEASSSPQNIHSDCYD